MSEVPDPSQGPYDAKRSDLLASQSSGWSSSGPWPIERAIEQLGGIPEEARTEILLDLIMQEVDLRRQNGETPTLQEYQLRFPTLAEQLRIQWHVDQILGPILEPTPGESTLAESSNNTRESSNSPIKIDRYEFIQQIGRGGIGVVYEVFDNVMKRRVALKRLKAGEDASPEEWDRLRAECQAISAARSPRVVEVYDFDIVNDQPYMTMELCRGGSLAKRIRGNPIDPKQAAQVGMQLCEALAVAHERRIIHRDLKPDNVLLDNDSDWSIKVADFGLAKFLDSNQHATQTGSVLGTPIYMAPEQAFGNAKHAGPEVDVYSIGAILYECLTGSPPFRGVTLAETLEHVRLHEPALVRNLAPSVPIDIETLVHKCLQKDPKRRYPSIRELSQDLDRFLHDQPILARRVSAAEKFWRVCKRNPQTTGLVATVLAMMVFSIVILVTLNFKITGQRTELQQLVVQKEKALTEKNDALNERQSALTLANESERMARRRAYAAQIGLANEALFQNQAARAETLFQNASQIPGIDELQGIEWWLIKNRLEMGMKSEFQSQDFELTSISADPQGQIWLAVGGGRDAGNIMVCSSQTGEVLFQDKVSSIINGCAIHPISGSLYLALGNGLLLRFGSDFKLQDSEQLSILCRSLAVSSDGQWMAVGGDQGELLIRNLQNGQSTVLSNAHKGPILFCFFNRSATCVFTSVAWGGEKKFSRKWDLRQWPPEQADEFPDVTLHDVNREETLLVGTDWGKLVVIENNPGKVVRSKDISTGPIANALFADEKTILAATRSDREVRRLAIDSLETIQNYSMPHQVMGLTYHPPTRTFAACDSKAVVRIWGLDNTRPEMVRKSGNLRLAEFIEDGHRLFMGSPTTHSEIWDPEEDKVETLNELQHVLTVSEDGQTVVRVLDGARMSRFAAEKRGGKSIAEIDLQGTLYDRSFALSSTGRWLALRVESRAIQVFDLNASNKPVFEIPALAYSVAFSPDERYLVAACQGGVVTRFDLQSGRSLPNLKEWEAFWAWGMSVAFSGDSSLVACGTESGVVRVWEVASGKLISQIDTGEGELVALHFFPGNQRLAIGGSAGNILIADIPIAQELLRLPTTSSQVYAIDVDPSGRAIAAVTRSGQIFVYRGQSDASVSHSVKSSETPPPGKN